MTITNLHQRKITAARLTEFEAKLAELVANPPTDPNAAIGHKLAVSQTGSYIDGFKAELDEFDQLSLSQEIPVERFDDLGEALIRARVASKLTQAQLAERVGLQTSAINRYELNGYRTASLERLAEIAEGLDFSLDATLLRK